MIEIFKEKMQKFPAGLYVTVIGFIGIFSVIVMRQKYEKKKQEAFISLFSEYEKKATPELLDELITKSQNSSKLKKRFGARLLQEVVLFRPDIFTKAWIKDPIKIKDDYDKFSEASLLIAENKLEDAVTQGENLQKDISKEKTPALYAFNSFRLAVLHDKLGHNEEAKKLFEQILAQSEVQDALNKAYSLETVSVSDYIQDRLDEIVSEK